MNFVLLHGTDGSPEINWFPWLTDCLRARGHSVWAPLLPENHTPNRRLYADFLFGSGYDFTDSVLVGHSSGAVSVLNLLMDERCQSVKASVLVGAWARMEGTPLDTEQFKDLFPPEGFDFDTIKDKASKLLYLHGDNDPYCPLDQAQWLASQTGGDIVIIPGGGHLGSAYPQFPQLITEIEARGIV